MPINRPEVSRALAKALAYAECGRPDEADAWARRLVALLGSAHILKSE